MSPERQAMCQHYFDHDCLNCELLTVCTEHPTCTTCPAHIEPTVDSPFACRCLHKADKSLSHCPYFIPIKGE